MKTTLKAKAMLQSRIIFQAALCVEDLLEETNKDGGRPWICVVEDHMKALFQPMTKHARSRRL